MNFLDDSTLDTIYARLFFGKNCMSNQYYDLTQDSTTGYYSGSWVDPDSSNDISRNWGACDFAYT